MPAREDVRLCVFCRRRPVDAAWRPFCSDRCKVRDLARWADGTYAVPEEPVADPDGQGLDRPGKEEGN